MTLADAKVLRHTALEFWHLGALTEKAKREAAAGVSTPTRQRWTFDAGKTLADTGTRIRCAPTFVTREVGCRLFV